MGTLSDITAQATNTSKRRSNSSMGYQILRSPARMEKENVSKSRSPHFMTPTFSSSKQSVVAGAKLEDRTSSPVPAKPIKAEGNNQWMKSAVKRVGLHRHGGDGTPRSKKEVHAKQPKTISFPDKFATPSHGKVSDSPIFSQERKQALNASPTDKPLPNPPVVQVGTSDLSIESKSLIDASDKPLRRSPSGSPDHEEDWPVLHPRRSTSPGTLQEMMRYTGTQLTEQAAPAQMERYPVLGNTLRQIPDDHLPISRYSATHRIPRKRVSSSNLKKEAGASVNLKSKKGSMHDPFRDGVYNTDLTAPRSRTSPTNILSVSAPATGTPTQETKHKIEPRQTRTSSLRARLSAGQIVNTGQSKVMGFTDFTAPTKTNPAPNRRDSLNKKKEAQGRRSTTPPTAPSLHNRSSREAIGASRAPAQFVAGSRRPAHPRRPSSRGSLRNEARASSPPVPSMPPTRPAPARPDSGAGDTDLAKKNGRSSAGTNTKQRIGSNPVSRQSSSGITDQRNEKIVSSIHDAPNPEDPLKQSPKRQARNEIGIYNDHSSQDLLDELDGSPPRTITNRSAPFLIDNRDTYALEAIEESPQRAYQLKRLSTHSPEYGPTLKISPAADRLIMGPDSSKEDRLLKKKSSKELDRAMKRDELKGRKSNATSASTANQSERPSSSQGITRSGSRLGLIDRMTREKKVKSVDLSLTSPKLLDLDNQRARQSSYGQDTQTSLAAPKRVNDRCSDPFFDAPEELPTESIKVIAPEQKDRERPVSVEDSWISPLKDENAVPAAEDDSTTVVPKLACGESNNWAPQLDNADPFEDNIASADVNYPRKEAQEYTSNGEPPKTPQKPNNKLDTSSGNFPPRSSSRNAPPDWSSNKKSPTPPLADHIPPPTPPKDFPSRQNNLGSLRGHASSQLDLKNGSSNHDSWRESVARDSYKSQASLTKGNSVLSNLKGLFHKRSSENEPVKSTAKAKAKSKVSITPNGSPFPSMSEIHPIHRPTLASTNRSKPLTPREPRSSNTNSNTQPPYPTTTGATAATPSFASPLPTEVSTTTTMAMQILESARHERSSPKKERLLELGKIMVESITQARNAEKAMEEARQAARQAEVAHALCRKSLNDVSRCVQEWKENGTLNGKL